MKWLLSILFFATLNTHGQSIVVKYIVIDTVIFNEGVNIEPFRSSFLTKVNNGTEFENNYYKTNYHPAFSCEAKFKEQSDIAISLPIDDNRGGLELHHIEKLGDTIHLPFYRIYKNCMFDSIVKSKSSYHHLNDTDVISYKAKRETILPDNSCKDTLKKIVLILNEGIYSVPVEFSKVESVSIYCGYPTKRDEKRELAYKFESKKINRKVKYNSFSFSFHYYRYLYTGKVDFNE